MPLNKTEYLLVKLAEECAEVGQRATKALTFGLQEVYRGGEDSAYRNPEGYTNTEVLMQEIADLAAVVGMLQDSGDLPTDVDRFRSMTRKKREKLERYMQVSRERGCLVDG